MILNIEGDMGRNEVCLVKILDDNKNGLVNFTEMDYQKDIIAILLNIKDSIC